MTTQIQNKLFRKASLDRLSSPEQLDLMMQVISPKGWIALVSLCSLVLISALWGVFGTIPTKVIGKCILIQSGGLANVTTKSAGRITEVLVNVGDIVKTGDPIAQLAQPELIERLEAAQSHLQELEIRKRQVQAFSVEGEHLQTVYLDQERKNLENQMQTLKEKINTNTELVVAGDKLLNQGFITKQAFISAKTNLSGAMLELANVRNQIKELSIKKFEHEKQSQNELIAVENQINEVKRGIDAATQDIHLSTQIETPYSGRVVEIKTGIGMLASAGSAILMLESLERNLDNIEAVVYVAATDGKKIKTGMEAEIVPSIIKREEYGFIRGQVISVADYPASPEGVMKVLKNQQLAKDLAGDVLSIEMRAKLIPADNPSGFKWSSSGGPQTKIASGTMCRADVVVKRQSPISLVIPHLRKDFGFD